MGDELEMTLDLLEHALTERCLAEADEASLRSLQRQCERWARSAKVELMARETARAAQFSFFPKP